MMRLTLTNDFHNTSVTVQVPSDGILTLSQVRRARRTLCPISGCRCGGNLGERGYHAVEIEPLEDGRCQVTHAKFLAKLNIYAGDVWEDVIRRYPHYDDEATGEADKSGMNDIIILTDGTKIGWFEADGEWRIY